jgi:hypothetical protein
MVHVRAFPLGSLDSSATDVLTIGTLPIVLSFATVDRHVHLAVIVRLPVVANVYPVGKVPIATIPHLLLMPLLKRHIRSFQLTEKGRKLLCLQLPVLPSPEARFCKLLMQWRA